MREVAQTLGEIGTAMIQDSFTTCLRSQAAHQKSQGNLKISNELPTKRRCGLKAPEGVQ